MGGRRGRRRRLLAAALGLAAWAKAAAAAPPELVRLRGTLDALCGAPVADGDYVLRAEVFDAAVGGRRLHAQETEVSLVGGAYTLTLAPAEPGERAPAMPDAPRLLEITLVSGPDGPIGATLLRVELARIRLAPDAAAADDGVPVDAVLRRSTDARCPAGYAEVAARGDGTVPAAAPAERAPLLDLAPRHGSAPGCRKLPPP